MRKPQKAEDFNENAFVNCHNYETLDDIVARVKEIDENDKLCLSMLNESIVKYKDGDIESYLFHIFDQPKQSAFRRPKSMYTDAVEKMVSRHWFFEKYIYKYYRKLLNQFFRLNNNTLLTSRRTK